MGVANYTGQNVTEGVLTILMSDGNNLIILPNENLDTFTNSTADDPAIDMLVTLKNRIVTFVGSNQLTAAQMDITVSRDNGWVTDFTKIS